jgi:hypothetical protein
MVAAPSRNGHKAVEDAVATRIVVLAGTATSSRDLVHQQPADAEVWGLNASYTWMPRWSRWFEMHDRDRYHHIQGEHLDWLRAQTCPIYMPRRYEDIPASVAYPLEWVTQGGRFRPLLTSSIAYMIALAVAEGFDEIRFAGIDMAMDSEYAYQRAACEYWIGVAEALGRKVVIPGNSPIGKAPLYGQEAPSNERMLLDWKDRMATERLRKYEDFLTKAYQIAYEARVEDKAGQFTPEKVTAFVEGLQEFVDEARANLAAVEGASQLLVKMQQQDGN